jgi:hypothetical protein
MSLILVIKIYVCSNLKLLGVEGRVAQIIAVEEELKGFRRGLAKPKVQPILSEAACPILLHDDRSRLCNVLVGDLKCVHVILERYPPHLFLYLFYLMKEKQRRKQTRALPN